MLPKTFLKDSILGILILSLAVGFMTLAIIDPSVRSSFADLAKVAVGAYIGFYIPSPK